MFCFVQMFDCLNEVPDATEEEIESALTASDWKIEAAVKILKINEILRTPEDQWSFGFSKNRAVCEMVLSGMDWNLDQAKNKVTKV
jgi:hypothetical protein